jgi:ribonuclease BN (tRNA processing enzyme)
VDKSNSYTLNEKLIELAKDADVFVMDADLMHTSFKDVAWAASASNAKQVVLTHMHILGWVSGFSPLVRQGTDDEIIEEIKSVYNGVVTIAKDLASIYI